MQFQLFYSALYCVYKYLHFSTCRASEDAFPKKCCWTLTDGLSTDSALRTWQRLSDTVAFGVWTQTFMLGAEQSSKSLNMVSPMHTSYICKSPLAKVGGSHERINDRIPSREVMFWGKMPVEETVVGGKGGAATLHRLCVGNRGIRQKKGSSLWGGLNRIEWTNTWNNKICVTLMSRWKVPLTLSRCWKFYQAARH